METPGQSWGVKTVKGMLSDNVSARGTLDRAKVSRALLQLTGTLRCLWRRLRDFLPRPRSSLMGEMWMNLADARETALGRRRRSGLGTAHF
jgi:hypothetical protein